MRSALGWPVARVVMGRRMACPHPVRDGLQSAAMLLFENTNRQACPIPTGLSL